MTTFIGTPSGDVANAATGEIAGFTGGTVAELQDAIGDEFEGGDGADVIRAGAGNDRLRGGRGGDVLDGGLGIDTVDYSDNYGRVIVDLLRLLGHSNAAEGDSYAGIENVIGSLFGDTLFGTNGVNRLDGGDGNDELIGALGADELVGGNGVDTASYADNQGPVIVDLSLGAGTGNAAEGDTYSSIENLTGSLYDDHLKGDSGANRLDGGNGQDVLTGGLGADVMVGGAGIDTVNYSDNWGKVYVNLTSLAGQWNAAAGDTYSGIEGVTGSIFDDQIYGNSGVNYLEGNDGSDLLEGLEGADVLSGGNGSDILRGGGGVNRLEGGAGADVLQGGGNDIAVYSRSPTGVTVNVTAGTAAGGHAQGDVLSGFDDVVGSDFDDVLTGTRVYGGLGNDTLTGNFAYGGAGADHINASVVDYSTATSRIEVNLVTGVGTVGDAAGDVVTNAIRIVGSAFDDRIVTDVDDIVNAGAGDDYVVAGYFLNGTSIATNTGDGGTDTLDFSTFTTPVNELALIDMIGIGFGIVTLYPQTTSTTGYRFANFEVVIGSQGSDYLRGSQNGETLNGHLGDDLLDGRAGNDVLIGGAGADTFVFGSPLGPTNIDTIVDYEMADQISLDNGYFTQLPVEAQLDATRFGLGSAATTAEQRILFDQTTGALYYDADGTGAAAAIQFAFVGAGLPLTAAEFIVI